MESALEKHPYFPFLLVYRTVLTGLALMTILKADFFPMLTGLVVLIVALSLGETIYAGIVYASIAQQRREEKAAALAAAEAARKREAEVFKSAQRESSEKYLEIGDFYAESRARN